MKVLGACGATMPRVARHGVVLALGWSAAVSGAAVSAAPAPRLAWINGQGALETREGATRPSAGTANSTAWQTPLGSVWKLFVYAYLQDNQVNESPYRCEQRQAKSDEEYCCDPGGSVGRDEALAQSCGLYFQPTRLKLDPQQWATYWQRQQAPAWLQQLNLLQPQTMVTVPSLLSALEHMPASPRLAARRALMPLNLRNDQVLQHWGTGPRFKTWSWQEQGRYIGGAAGWWADGTPFWLSGTGTSRRVLQDQAHWVATQWQSVGGTTVAGDAALRESQPCVNVDFFDRYPLKSIRRVDPPHEPTAGPMRGAYQVQFETGTALRIEASEGMQLRRDGQQWRIQGRFLLEEYVARVVDREGVATSTQAARALAVAARTYLIQNASEQNACRFIVDDSRTQRVSPNAPTAAALSVANFTQDVILTGGPVQYHSSRGKAGVMSWKAAVDAQAKGQDFEDILRQSYPRYTLATWSALPDCRVLDGAQNWLRTKEVQWRQALRQQPGFEPIAATTQICELGYGTPHSDQRRLTIRVREWRSREGRVTLIHEYLHLAFRHHPNGMQEAWVESLAQKLADS